MSHRKINCMNILSKNAMRKCIAFQINPPILKSPCVIERKGYLLRRVVTVKTRKQTRLNEQLKTIAYTKDDLPVSNK